MTLQEALYRFADQATVKSYIELGKNQPAFEVYRVAFEELADGDYSLKRYHEAVKTNQRTPGIAKNP